MAYLLTFAAKKRDDMLLVGECIVSDDIPDNATVVMPKPVVIEHSSYRCNKYKLIK